MKCYSHAHWDLFCRHSLQLSAHSPPDEEGQGEGDRELADEDHDSRAGDFRVGKELKQKDAL